MLEQYPKTPSEQIERWCYIGIAADKCLTENQIVLLQLGHGQLVFVDNDEQTSDN